LRHSRGKSPCEENHSHLTAQPSYRGQASKARGFELRAALSLAKLYHSTDRPADAHTVLAPALKGCSPTPEFPEIGEAQMLLAALAS